MVFICIVTFNSVAHASTATGVGTINASIVDDSGSAVSLGGANDTAQMSFADTSYSAKWYNLTVQLTGLPSDKVNSVAIALPLGMKFQSINPATVLAGTGQFANDVSSSSYAHIGLTAQSGYTFNNGVLTFALNQGVAATSVTIPVTIDPTISTSTITNAVQVTLSNSVGSVSDTLENVKVTQQANVNFPRLGNSSNYFLSGGTYVPSPSAVKTHMGDQLGLNRFVTGGQVTIHVSDTRVVVTNTDTSGNWSMDSSDSANGNYTFTYTAPGGIAYLDTLTAPYSITFPSTVAWTTGDVVTVKLQGGSVNFWQPDTSVVSGTLAANIGSTVDPTFVSLTVTGTTGTATYNYSPSTELVTVNQGKSSLSETMQIYQGNPDPSANDSVNALGYFYLNNGSAVDSAPKTVAMHFDSTVMGVMGAYIPIPSGGATIAIQYKTTAQTTWQTASVTVNQISGNYPNVGWLSYKALGITSRSEFITDLKYDLGVIPANSTYNAGTAGGYFYFVGKWLGSSSDTAQASIQVYDADSSGAHDTGVSTVTIAQTAQPSTGVSVSSQSNTVVNAGSLLNVSHTVSAQGTGSAPFPDVRNEVLYIRSKFVDENGNLLPIRNVKLTTGADRGSIDITADTEISTWEADEDGDGTNDTVIVKIDTSTVPNAEAYLATQYINSNGTTTGNSLNLSYSIQTTQLTQTQTMQTSNMLYVYNPDAVNTAGMNGTTTRNVTASSDPAIFAAIQHGETWATGFLLARILGDTKVTQVNGVQSILITSQIMQANGTSWLTWRQGDEPIAVGVSANSGFQLKSNIINNAGAAVSGTEVYIPIPRANDNWGSLQTGTPQLSLILKGPATTSLSGGSIDSYTVKYGVNVTPTDNGASLQGYTWVDASQVTDWSQVNCIQVVANDVGDQANLQVVMDVKADSAQTSPVLVEGLLDIWHPTYFQDLSSATGVYQGWYAGADFGVQSALSGIKGRLFNDVNRNGLYDGASENLSAVWTLDVYRIDDFVVSGFNAAPVQELTTNPDGTYEVVNLVSTPGNYVLFAINPSVGTLMFTRTAERSASNGTGQYLAYGANTASSGDGDARGGMVITAGPTIPGNTPPTDVPDSATYNIGVTAATNTTLTFQSADTSKGTISGSGVSSGKETLTNIPSTVLDPSVIPTVAAAAGYTYTGWVQVAAGAAAPAWNATATVTAADAAGSPLPFGGGNNTYGFDSYDYYAVFSANQYGVSFDANKPVSASTNVSGLMANQTATFGEAFTLNANGFTLPGYSFTGWNTAADGSGTSYTDAQVFASWSTASDVVLYAQWTANQYTVSFNATKPSTATGSVSGSMSSQTATFDQNLTLTANAFTLTGYTFTGWNTAADGSGTAVADAYAYAPYSTVGNTVLYAQWTANQYTVSFDGNKPSAAPGAVAGSMSNQNVTFDQNVTLTTNAFTLTGYSFTGWNTAADGSGTSYTNAQTVNPWTVAANTTLFAQWSADQYAISYAVNTPSGASTTPSGSMSNQQATFNQNVTLTANAFALPGYTFTGWNTAADGSGIAYADAQAFTPWLTAGAVTLYAQWTANVYTVSFDANVPSGASTTLVGSMDDETYTFDQDAILTANDFLLQGYTFTGWNTAADGSGTAYKDASTISPYTTVGDTTLYAQWSANTYKVSFDGNKPAGASTSLAGSMSDESVTFDQDVTLTANGFTLPGYSFAGWNTAADGSGTAYADASTAKYTTVGDTTLYAQWTANVYTVSFDANVPSGASTTPVGSMDDETYTFDQDAILTANDFLLQGYTFAGWNTAADGSGTAYKDASTISPYTTVGDTTLYAQWSANTYKVSFDGNKPAGASTSLAGSMTDESVTFDQDATLTANDFSLQGYTFTGWNTAADGSGTAYADASTAKYTTVGDTTLFAQWSANEYELVFDANKPASASTTPSGSMGNQTVTFDQADNLVVNEYTLSGYSFTGWNTQADGSGLALSDEDVMTLDKATFDAWNTSSARSRGVVGTLTLFAQWSANGYLVSYDANKPVDASGVLTGSMSSGDAVFDQDYTVEANAFTLPGYTFTGWNTKADGSGTAYAAGYVFSPYELTENITLFAQWSKDPVIAETGSTVTGVFLAAGTFVLLAGLVLAIRRMRKAK